MGFAGRADYRARIGHTHRNSCCSSSQGYLERSTPLAQNSHLNWKIINTRYQHISPMDRFNVPFGTAAITVGAFLLYAAWANPPFGASSACATSTSTPQVVHFSPAFTLEYYNHCGGALDYQFLFLLGFTAIGITLTTGGAVSLKGAVN